jgi:putative oxygen-independent coproporphyrinogen III oxidase
MISLYVHIPFCQKKCFYCSFVVAIGQERKADRYVMALRREARVLQARDVKSVYIGGGTPSLLSPAQIHVLFSDVVRYFSVDEVAEITFEANPESVSDETLIALRECGVNRVSLGAQTFDEQQLRRLGRNHGVDDIFIAREKLFRHGFDNVSVDLMFALPDQTLSRLRDDIDHLISLDVGHVSLYELDVEPRSLFHARRQNILASSVRARFYADICQSLSQAGYRQYEISNFARPGLESRHNLNYWMGGEYIGIGVGAHSFLDGRRFWNTDALGDYLSRVESGRETVMGEELLRREQLAKERLLFGLRMNQGVVFDALRTEFPEVFDGHYLAAIEAFIESGHLCSDGDMLRVTEAGRLVLDEISARLI